MFSPRASSGQNAKRRNRARQNDPRATARGAQRGLRKLRMSARRADSPRARRVVCAARPLVVRVPPPRRGAERGSGARGAGRRQGRPPSDRPGRDREPRTPRAHRAGAPRTPRAPPRTPRASRARSWCAHPHRRASERGSSAWVARTRGRDDRFTPISHEPLLLNCGG